MGKHKKDRYCCIISTIDFDNSNLDKVFIKEIITKKVDEIYKMGINVFSCIGDYGISMIAAETIIHLRKKYKNMKFQLIEPGINYSCKLDKKIMDKYRYICKRADDYITLCEKSKLGLLTAKSYGEFYMLEISEIVLIDKDKYGCIRFAENNNIKVIKLFD